MTILSRDILNNGPYIQFADYPSRSSENWRRDLDPAYFRDHLFYEMSDSLLGVFCKTTNGGSPIDPYESIELVTDFEIRKLAADLLIWTFDLIRSKSDIFRKEVEDYGFYSDSRRPQHGSELTGEDLRLDMIETLLMLVGRLTKMARQKNCLVINGI